MLEKVLVKITFCVSWHFLYCKSEKCFAFSSLVGSSGLNAEKYII